MGKAITSLILAVCALFLLTGCKYDNLDKAIEKDIPFNVQQIVHMEKLKEGTLVLYTTKQKDGASRVEALGAAFIEGSSKDGWENTGHNHWVYYKNKFMMQYADVFHLYNKDGKLRKNIPVIFGKIMSPEIAKVEAANPDKKYSEIKIVKKGRDRFYYAVGDFRSVRGLSKNGKVLNKQESK